MEFTQWMEGFLEFYYLNLYIPLKVVIFTTHSRVLGVTQGDSTSGLYSEMNFKICYRSLTYSLVLGPKAKGVKIVPPGVRILMNLFSFSKYC